MADSPTGDVPLHDALFGGWWLGWTPDHADWLPCGPIELFMRRPLRSVGRRGPTAGRRREDLEVDQAYATYLEALRRVSERRPGS